MRHELISKIMSYTSTYIDTNICVSTSGEVNCPLSLCHKTLTEAITHLHDIFNVGYNRYCLCHSYKQMSLD